MSEKRTVVQPTAPFGCLACGAGEGEYHRVGCSHLQELNEAVRTLSGAGAVSPGPGPGTPPAPTGEPGDPAQGPGGGAGAPGPDGVDSTAQADWRDSQPRLMSLGGPGPWDPQAVARLQESLKSQRRQPIIAVAGPLPEIIDRGTFVTVAALDELKGRVATLEAQAESVGAGLSRCESSVAGMTTTHADRIETIEDEVQALKRAVLELREPGFSARHGASDQKLSILINGEPAPYSSFRIPEASDHVRCPRCGSDDPDRYIICTGGDTTEPYFKASCHYLKDSDPWHEIAKATQAPYAVGTKRPTHARLVRAVERWVGGYAIPAGTVLEIIGWSVDYPRIANPVAPANHPEPWFTLHPGEWEACEGPVPVTPTAPVAPAPYVPKVGDVVTIVKTATHYYHEWWLGTVGTVEKQPPWINLSTHRIRLAYAPNYGGGDPRAKFDAHGVETISLLPEYVRLATPEECAAAGLVIVSAKVEEPAEPVEPKEAAPPTPVVPYVPKVGDVVHYGLEGDEEPKIVVSVEGNVYYKWLDEPNDTPTMSVTPSHLRKLRDSTEEERRTFGLVSTVTSARTEEPVEPAKERAPGRPSIVRLLCDVAGVGHKGEVEFVVDWDRQGRVRVGSWSGNLITLDASEWEVVS